MSSWLVIALIAIFVVGVVLIVWRIDFIGMTIGKKVLTVILVLGVLLVVYAVALKVQRVSTDRSITRYVEDAKTKIYIGQEGMDEALKEDGVKVVDVNLELNGSYVNIDKVRVNGTLVTSASKVRVPRSEITGKSKEYDLRLLPSVFSNNSSIESGEYCTKVFKVDNKVYGCKKSSIYFSTKSFSSDNLNVSNSDALDKNIITTAKKRDGEYSRYAIRDFNNEYADVYSIEREVGSSEVSLLMYVHNGEIENCVVYRGYTRKEINDRLTKEYIKEFIGK